jgi:hypothetical protein
MRLVLEGVGVEPERGSFLKEGAWLWLEGTPFRLAPVKSALACE